MSRLLPFATSIALLAACAPAHTGGTGPAAAGSDIQLTDDARPVTAEPRAPAPQAAVMGFAEAPPPTATPVPVTAAPGRAALASWYGPGFWGNRTACGLILTEQLNGVAHRTLPCGTLVTLRYADRTVTVPVVDNGPHVASREFDLTYATRVDLGCPDLCRLVWIH